MLQKLYDTNINNTNMNNANTNNNDKNNMITITFIIQGNLYHPLLLLLQKTNNVCTLHIKI